jgi:DNA-binding transcriptional LysR family regulator
LFITPLGYRFPASGSIYRWEFERDGRALSFDITGSIIVNDGTLLVSLALAGLGLAYVADIAVKNEVFQER